MRASACACPSARESTNETHSLTQAFLSFSTWFDFFVVTVSVIDLILAGQGVNFNFMRLFRIFRVVRVFNKFEDMRRILIATVSALGPVLNAFLFFGVINSIYAVLGVTLFQDKGEERFGSFSLCFYTLLGITTGEAWTPHLKVLSRQEGEVAGEEGDNAIAFDVILYFVSYILVVTIVALNIIVAVLLEGFR